MRRIRITAEEGEKIIAAVAAKPHASLVARENGWSFSTVWRVAVRAGIELTAGREAKGYRRFSPAQRARIDAALRANPQATQEQVARAAGVSRSSVGRVVRARQWGIA
jgi:hypothetical protein